MAKSGKGIVKTVVFAALAVLIGGGAVFALNLTGPGAKADSVAVLKAQGITCGSCAGRIEQALKEKAGVAAVEVDIDAGRVIVAYDAKAVTPGQLAESVTAVGYGSSVLQTLPADQYRAVAGASAGARAGRAGGCGGKNCCGKKNINN